MEKKYTPIPRFNDHGAGCKGHANFLLDCEYTEQADRDLIVQILDRLINEKELHTETHAASR